MRKIFFIFCFIFSLALVIPEAISNKSLDNILSEIRKEQGIKQNEKINPDKVSEKKLEELGDQLMEIMIGNHEEHERMDAMMGGDGSKSLNAMHASIAYRYLSGVPFGMMGYNGMMDGYRYNRNYKGGSPMMWNNNYGMMGWGFGGWVMWIFILIVLIAIGLLIYFIIKKNSTGNEAPIDILKKRYAKGEISKKEFDKMKKDL
jgi:Short C-terminal domain